MDQAKRRRQDVYEAWQAFPDLDGRHWKIRLIEGRWAVANRDGGQLLAMIGQRRSYPHRGSFRPVRTVQMIDGPLYRRKHLGGAFRGNTFFVDAGSGRAVLKVVDRHYNHQALGQLHVLSQADSTQVDAKIRFPIEGYGYKAVMTAVDDLGKTRMSFRRTPKLSVLLIQPRRAAEDVGIDIVLWPGVAPDPDLLLIASVASEWMITYFKSPPSPV